MISKPDIFEYLLDFVYFLFSLFSSRTSFLSINLTGSLPETFAIVKPQPKLQINAKWIEVFNSTHFKSNQPTSRLHMKLKFGKEASLNQTSPIN